MGKFCERADYQNNADIDQHYDDSDPDHQEAPFFVQPKETEGIAEKFPKNGKNYYQVENMVGGFKPGQQLGILEVSHEKIYKKGSAKEGHEAVKKANADLRRVRRIQTDGEL